MPNLEKIKLEIGKPAIVLTIVSVDYFAGTHGPSVTFATHTHGVTVSQATAEKQLARHNLTIAQAPGMTFKFEKVAGGQSGFVNINPVATVGAGELTAGLTPPTPKAAPASMGGPLPFDNDEPVFDPDSGEPIHDAPYAPLADANAAKRAAIVALFREALHASVKYHAEIEALCDSRTNSGKSAYCVTAEAVNAGAATLLIAWDKSGLLRA